MIVYTQNTDRGKYVQIPRLSAKLLNQYFKSTQLCKVFVSKYYQTATGMTTVIVDLRSRAEECRTLVLDRIQHIQRVIPSTRTKNSPQDNAENLIPIYIREREIKSNSRCLYLVNFLTKTEELHLYLF